jgi:F0F1-type ATP synthase epsilon subunit
MHLLVLSPAGPLLEVDGVAWVRAQLADGAGISIYPSHAPLVGETVAAPVTYADEDGEHAIELPAGILQVDRAGVTLLADRPAAPGEMPDDG